MTAVEAGIAKTGSVVRFVGPLRAPVSAALRETVAALLREGVRSIELDFSDVSDLDAAGMGELVHLYAIAGAADAALQVTHVRSKLRRLFEVADLRGLLGEAKARTDG